MSSPAEPAAVLVLVRDLLFASRIRATAQSLGASVQMLRDPDQLQHFTGHRLIVDLNQPAALQASLAWKQRTGGQVTGFISHVDTETIQSARQAGIDQILPRSRFTEILPQLLT